ncbi:hypothetical protein BC939DRAFT_183837 [Gamsiella multidivaricata]|uniref:uncharacterized protein n=1 Tax=Gamsiella multidivaricata TaxID=101098 RepID=UPI00221E50EB|nr:uncharacterized protein BC939DRAFT_183837 [Gamsiella multidivaricata]KAG0358603.1 hypothetical protein BGZ54_010354 [Gamsiella multidivaricata]KAI7831349.1 hypothetical protein BC939DRAFT_183837 [Gamsiella multidivaricata]
MAKFSTLNALSLAILAIIFTSLLATVSTVEAASKPPASKSPAFTVFAKTNLGGKSKLVTGYGCINHNLGTVGSVKYSSGPVAQIRFYAGKNCSGTVTHQMDTSTVKRMGGPYKSYSVKVTK